MAAADAALYPATSCSTEANMADDAAAEIKIVQAPPHALVVPATTRGHINGSLLLSRTLATVGFQVSFVYFSSDFSKFKPANTPSVQRLNSGAHPSTTHGDDHVRFHVVDDGLNPDEHGAKNPFPVTPSMMQNLESLILQLKEQGTPITCLISDSFLPWTLPIAQRLGIPRVDFRTSSALGYRIIIHTPVLFSDGIFPERGDSAALWKSKHPLMVDHVPGLGPLPSEVFGEMIRFADPSSPIIRLFKEMSSCVRSAERILIQTVSELEQAALHAFEAVGTAAYAIGPLHIYKEDQGNQQENGIAAKQAMGASDLTNNEQAACLAWLDTQEMSSVIYIAFGSFLSPSLKEIQELAFGLEAIERPFLWVLTDNSRANVDLAQILPDGFLERTHGKGMIISWAPQVKVLEHQAVGGFLTHCGWNSVLDSLWAGVPMLCCPLALDQRGNSHYVCNVWQVGLELERSETGKIEREFVKLGVRALMQEEVGLNARAKVQEVTQIVRKACQPGGQSFSNLQKFYEDMKALCFKASIQSHSS